MKKKENENEKKGIQKERWEDSQKNEYVIKVSSASSLFCFSLLLQVKLHVV